MFHFIHHYVNKQRRKKDETYPYLPEEQNPVFLIYPLCMIMSISFAVIWIFKKNIFMKKPLYVSKISFLLYNFIFKIFNTNIFRFSSAASYQLF